MIGPIEAELRQVTAETLWQRRRSKDALVLLLGCATEMGVIDQFMARPFYPILDAEVFSEAIEAAEALGV